MELVRSYFSIVSGLPCEKVRSAPALETWASGGGLPDPIPNRPSRLDTMDRKSLRKLWEEDELRLGGAVRRNSSSVPIMALGQSREVGSTILRKTVDSKLNGETRCGMWTELKRRVRRTECKVFGTTATGIPTQILEEGRPGHYGLSGMR